MRRGVAAGAPVQVATFPLGVIFGAVAAQAGLDLAQIMAMTGLVFAGASQFAALQQMAEGAPAIAAVLTGALVNLRMAMYSAALAAQWPQASLRARVAAAAALHDQTFALTARRAAEHPQEPVGARMAFFFGVGLVSGAAWLTGGLVGALAGARLPESWGLDFAVPVTFLAIVAPLLREPGHRAAAATAAVAALAMAALPDGPRLLLAAALGIGAGVAVGSRAKARGA